MGMDPPIQVNKNKAEITGIWSYLETVDWSDPWFTALFAFHVLAFLVTYITRNKHTLQAVHFGILLMLVYFAQSLNEIAAQNYQLFSRQQYFDSHGMFISVVWSSPILVNALLIIIWWILTSSQLMVNAGRLKLEVQKRRDAKKAEEEKKAR